MKDHEETFCTKCKCPKITSYVQSVRKWKTSKTITFNFVRKCPKIEARSLSTSNQFWSKNELLFLNGRFRILNTFGSEKIWTAYQVS